MGGGHSDNRLTDQISNVGTGILLQLRIITVYQNVQIGDKVSYLLIYCFSFFSFCKEIQAGNVQQSEQNYAGH